MSRRRRARGMTLLEVLIALLIASVGLLGALAMLGTLMQGGTFARSVTEASILAQAKVEDQLARVTLPALNTAFLDGTDGMIDRFGQPNAGVGPYTRQYVWSSFTDALGATRNRVTVTVTWKDALGGSHQVIAERDRAP